MAKSPAPQSMRPSDDPAQDAWVKEFVARLQEWLQSQEVWASEALFGDGAAKCFWGEESHRGEFSESPVRAWADSWWETLRSWKERKRQRFGTSSLKTFCEGLALLRRQTGLRRLLLALFAMLVLLLAILFGPFYVAQWHKPEAESPLKVLLARPMLRQTAPLCPCSAQETKPENASTDEKKPCVTTCSQAVIRNEQSRLELDSQTNLLLSKQAYARANADAKEQAEAIEEKKTDPFERMSELHLLERLKELGWPLVFWTVVLLVFLALLAGVASFDRWLAKRTTGALSVFASEVASAAREEVPVPETSGEPSKVVASTSSSIKPEPTRRLLRPWLSGASAPGLLQRVLADERFASICANVREQFTASSMPSASLLTGVGNYLYTHHPGFVESFDTDSKNVAANPQGRDTGFWVYRLNTLHAAATRVFFQCVVDDDDFVALLKETARDHRRLGKIVPSLVDRLKEGKKESGTEKGEAVSGWVLPVLLVFLLGGGYVTFQSVNGCCSEKVTEIASRLDMMEASFRENLKEVTERQSNEAHTEKETVTSSYYPVFAPETKQGNKGDKGDKGDPGTPASPSSGTPGRAAGIGEPVTQNCTPSYVLQLVDTTKTAQRNTAGGAPGNTGSTGATGATGGSGIVQNCAPSMQILDGGPGHPGATGGTDSLVHPGDVMIAFDKADEQREASKQEGECRAPEKKVLLQYSAKVGIDYCLQLMKPDVAPRQWPPLPIKLSIRHENKADAWDAYVGKMARHNFELNADLSLDVVRHRHLGVAGDNVILVYIKPLQATP